LKREDSACDTNTNDTGKIAAANNQVDSIPSEAHEIDGLLSNIRDAIHTARLQAVRAVDVVQVRTCWTIGQYIVEFEQGGASRAAYGKRLLSDLSDSLTAEFGKGFDERNLRHMRAFYAVFSIWNALRTELTWACMMYVIAYDII